jgi:2',3'-cyclic-nucleotide 2'-phosphodiesterase (5'-nucleotidase family)
MRRTGILLNLTIILIVGCKHPFGLTSHQDRFYTPGKTDSVYTGDQKIQNRIKPYQSSMESKMNVVIGRTAHVMEKGQPESTLGNLVADLCLDTIRKLNLNQSLLMPHICILNSGGLRSALPEGDIRLRNLYELMPFENELVVLKLTAPQMDELIRYIISKGGVPMSGIRINLSYDTIPVVQIGDQTLNTTAEYWVVTSDFLASGGDGMSMFTEAAETIKTGIKVRDAIHGYFYNALKNNITVSSLKDGRYISK